MPIFYFHLYNEVVACDREGQELADEAAAHVVAVDSARDMAAAGVRKGDLHLDHRIEVEDESGRIVFTVHFRDAVKVEP